jgi:hypothetical protein
LRPGRYRFTTESWGVEPVRPQPRATLDLAQLIQSADFSDLETF